MTSVEALDAIERVYMTPMVEPVREELARLRQERDAALVENEKLRALLKQVHSVMNDIPAPPYPYYEIEAFLRREEK